MGLAIRINTDLGLCLPIEHCHNIQVDGGRRIRVIRATMVVAMTPVRCVCGSLPGTAQQDKSSGNRLRSWGERLITTCRPPSGTPHPARVLLSALFISLVFLTVPMAAANLGVDSSWCAVLNWAHERGLQFGKDIVFTYGPLGYLIAPYTLTQPSGSLILTNAALSFHAALGLCLVMGRLAWPWRYLLLGTFVVEAANTELRSDLSLEIGLLCWGLLCISESSRRQKLCAVFFVLLATFAALSKVIYLFVAGFSVCAIACCLA